MQTKVFMRRLNLHKVNQKIKSYVGFLKRSNKIVYGLDNFEKKTVSLIVYSSELSANSKEKCEKIASKNNCKCYEIESNEFLELVPNEKIMAFASRDEGLSKAIQEELD